MDSQSVESIQPPSVIPSLTVTSSDDVDFKERKDTLPDESENASHPKDEDTIKRPTDSPIQLNTDYTVDGGHGLSAIIEDTTGTTEQVSYPTTPVIMATTPDVELLSLPRPKSASTLTTPTLLSPGLSITDCESDHDTSSQPVSDTDDVDLTGRLKVHPLAKDHADSDPNDTSTSKKGKKAKKRLKSSFKTSQKNKGVVPNKKGALGELALASMKMEASNDEDLKSGKVKVGKSKESRKKKSSKRQVLSPSYRQKNEDFHKFFKDLPATERLLVDYACALMKDILVQGRLYVSQNYLCFHSTILKWQTAVTVNLVDIDQMTKEKTVKVIPNAIQVLMKDKTKMTFTSFTARDKAYVMIFRLWQNALLEKPMSADDLWSQIHRHYGEELGGCSSDDDYVRPKYMPKKHQSFGDVEGDLKYDFTSSGKTKKKKKSSNSTQTPTDFEKDDKSVNKSSKSSSMRHSSQDSPTQFQADSTGDDKSSHSSQLTQDDVSLPDDVIEDDDENEDDYSEGDGERRTRSRKSSKMEEAEVQDAEDDEPAEFVMQDLTKVSLNRTYEVSAPDMFRIIFGDDCPFWIDSLINKGTTDIDFGTWYDDTSVKDQKLRELSYTLRLDNAIGPKTSFVKETQVFYPCQEGKSYAIDCFAQNYGIPYADYFHTAMRYCIRKVTKNTCELRITSELRYKKTPWGLVKNFIEKNVASGLTDNFKKLEYQLLERIEYEKSQPQVEGAKTRKNSNLRRRKRRSESATVDTQNRRGQSKSSDLPNGLVGGGDAGLSTSDVNNNKTENSTHDVTIGAPSLLPSNGYIPNQHSYATDSPKLHYFGQGGKFIIGAILFIFILLIYSNFSMYQRLTTLEQVTAAAATADGVDPSVTAALLDRPGVPITSNPEILSTYLQAIDKRLRRLEDTVMKFAETSSNKWEKMEKNWESLQNTIQTIISQHWAKDQ